MPRPFVAIVLSVSACAAQTGGAAFFEKKVRPLLARQCLGCHSAAANPIMGGLRLDGRDEALKGGSRGVAIVPGKPDQSLLIKAIRHTDGAPKMPPGPKLKEADAAVLAEWIAIGAPWGSAAARQTPSSARKNQFWAFQTPRKPDLPKTSQPDWVQSPIDAFVLRNLEAKGLKPAPPADKRTLIRRATFDLTGLPPTTAEVREFLADDSPRAFAKVVDRLLNSPRYGERWARHWLDVARYADSNGLDENLVYKNAFRYRDYVIDAFNKDKPYDQFVQEQLAGDLLPPSNDPRTMYERWTATGFLSLGAKMLAEDDPVKMEMDIVDEQLDTTGRTFLGLTVGCARCHDHKFDPIPQADYYAMAGIFKSAKTMEHFKVVAKWHEYVLAPKEDRDRLSAHEKKIENKGKEIGAITKRENERLIAEATRKAGAYLLASHEAHLSEQIHIKAIAEDSSIPENAVIRAAGSFDQGNVPKELKKKETNVPKGRRGPYFAEYEIMIPAGGAFQIDILDEEKGAGTADLWINGKLMKRGGPPVENREASPEAGGWTPIGIFTLDAGRNVIRLQLARRFPYFEKLLIAPNTLPAGSPIPRSSIQIARDFDINPSFLEQLTDHLKRSNGAAASVLYAWENFGKPLTGWSSPSAALFQDFRATTREALAARYGELFAEVAGGKDKLEDKGREALRELLVEKFGPFRAPEDARQYYTEESRDLVAKLEKEQKDLEAATPEFPRAMGVIESGRNADLAIHIRGSHWTLGKTAPRGFLSAIPVSNSPSIPAESSGRLELARWMTAKDHPLTSRVMANRIWRWRFGRGVVPSTDNFGQLGEKPTNQPLLDYLAVRFVEDGWSIKAMHRLLMLSSTYQMSSRHEARAAESDPDNVSLWRMSRRRLEAEEIRDAIMAVSGGLEFANGGSILTYKDRAYVANTSRRGDIDYDRAIRAIYIPVVRSSMYEVFSAFDLPDPSTPQGDRDATVVAPQALFMLNGSVLLNHSRKLADALLALPSADDAARVREAFERALSRPPTAAEIDQALTFIGRIANALKDRKPAEADRRAWAWQSFCKGLIASNEFVYLN